MPWTNDKTDLTTIDGEESTSSSTDSDGSEIYQESLISEPELVGVLQPREDDDDDHDEYVPYGRTASGNFPKNTSKTKLIKPEEEKNKDNDSPKKQDDKFKIIRDLKDDSDKQNGKKDTVEDIATKIIEKEQSEGKNGRKDSLGDDSTVNEMEDVGRYARSVSFCGKKLEGLAHMAAEAARNEKRTSQWEELMRKFSEAHKAECKTVSLDIPRAQRSIKQFPTGSTYEGTWDLLGMSGYGTYTFPNGVIYVGDFEDGMFHGDGELRYPEGAVMRGTWRKGHMIERTLHFADGLEYNEDDWGYCKMPDRRFTIEYENGLQPSGKSILTADQPTRDIPEGYYDTGDGFYDPKTKIVYSADNITNIVRSAGTLEAKWIVENCRTSSDEAVGPRQDLYEEWSEPQTNPEPPPPPAACTRASRRDTTFSDEVNFVPKTDKSPEDSDYSTSSSSREYN